MMTMKSGGWEKKFSRLVKNILRSTIKGGRQREVRIELDPKKMTGFGVSVKDIKIALQGVDVSTQAGALDKNNTRITVTSSSFLSSVDQVKRLVVSKKGWYARIS
jgi:multidrug efflux pump subunit AcrB